MTAQPTPTRPSAIELDLRNGGASGTSKSIPVLAPLHGRDLPNAMTVDVEDYFQVSAFADRIQRGDWSSFECRIPRNVDRILELFDRFDVKGTFFTLGWVATHYPDVVRRIAAAGHEIASHGCDHIRVGDQSPREFRDDVIRARQLLEDVSGCQVVGYRAASFSISADTQWAYDELAEGGYLYSSSIYPISHDHYGMPSSPRFPYMTSNAQMLEIPLSTYERFSRNWPCAGGGYFRLLPIGLSRRAIRRLVADEKMPAVFYFHPWELDPDQPRVSGLPLKTRFRHYVNLSRFEQRLATMLGEFRWGRMDEIFLKSASG